MDKQATYVMNNQASMTPPNEINKATRMGPKEMKIYKEFKIITLKILNKMQDITRRQSKSRKMYREY